MKTFLYIIIGLLLGVLAISLGITAFHALMNLAVGSALINGLFCFGSGLLSVKCFKKA